MKEAIKNTLFIYVGSVIVLASLLSFGIVLGSIELTAKLFPGINFDALLLTLALTATLIPGIPSISFWIPLLVIVGIVLFYAGVNSNRNESK